MTQARGVFFSDFDGTITDVDFYELVLAKMAPALAEDAMPSFRRGELTLFDLLDRIFSSIRLTEHEVLALLPELQPDPDLARDFDRLADAGWELHVVSAGSSWYIERLFEQVGVQAPVTIHANPGRFEKGRGLVMSLPDDARVARHDIGIDKAAVVRLYSDGAETIAFAGNSAPDLPAARIATECFAREPLGGLLRAEGIPFRPFVRWHDVAELLLEQV